MTSQMADCSFCSSDPYKWYHRCTSGTASLGLSTATVSNDGNRGDQTTFANPAGQMQSYPLTMANNPYGQGQFMQGDPLYQWPTLTTNNYTPDPGFPGNSTIPTPIPGDNYYNGYYTPLLSSSVPPVNEASTSFAQQASFPPVMRPVGTPAITNAAEQRRQTPAKFFCPYCPGSFTAGHNYRNHILAHNGDRPFICHVCDSTFRTVGDLRRHERTRRHAQMLHHQHD
ncbi:hypothetical protein AB1N83_004207 [Pleurotus pulmonarius]